MDCLSSSWHNNKVISIVVIDDNKFITVLEPMLNSTVEPEQGARWNEAGSLEWPWNTGITTVQMSQANTVAICKKMDLD